MLPPEIISSLPSAPGVYQFKDAAGRVIYVGKAKNLRARVRSYFLEKGADDPKTGTLVREATDVSTILLDNAREALALENNMIKQLQPRFNVLLRDDKTYPYIKLTINEKYPRIYVTRRLKKDGSLYYGPYFPGGLAHRLAHFIHRTFKVPSCTVDLNRAHARPCLQYYIQRCLGPCVSELTTNENWKKSKRWPRPVEMIWMCSDTTRRGRWSPSTCSTRARAECSTGGNFSGRMLPSRPMECSIPVSSSRRC
jgi:excinuclease ABC subunit C